MEIHTCISLYLLAGASTVDNICSFGVERIVTKVTLIALQIIAGIEENKTIIDLFTLWKVYLYLLRENLLEIVAESPDTRILARYIQ